MKDFENGKTEAQGIYYSRYIASWLNQGGDYFGEQFREWLRSNGCTEQEIIDIEWMATCGKMELEFSAKVYVDKMNKIVEDFENGKPITEEP